LRNPLDNSLKAERSNIISLMEALKANNYQLQAKILKLNSLDKEESIE
jgi:hypothetical protein